MPRPRQVSRNRRTAGPPPWGHADLVAAVDAAGIAADLARGAVGVGGADRRFRAGDVARQGGEEGREVGGSGHRGGMRCLRGLRCLSQALRTENQGEEGGQDQDGCGSLHLDLLDVQPA